MCICLCTVFMGVCNDPRVILAQITSHIMHVHRNELRRGTVLDRKCPEVAISL